ncbi:phospho-acceptor domain-containing protein [Winogradskyella epiphytica]|uniref:histidine kinase n=1 Tax=Winogradskyella epiphytica TaxID=262005 RepID=A0A2V4XHU1_9FLAO|nr:response regulator [Winogradskyella epiphytica]PYE82850.1 phospho-acceptor domain-containing protein [Winogradskyella epiphytica]GGW54113.1 histidine kinase [Winogradskyella epiphytica]
MCFPKSNTVISLFVLLSFSGLISLAQTSDANSYNSSTCSFNDHALDSLIKNENLYEAALSLNDAINFAKKRNLKSIEAKSYNTLANVLGKLSNFKTAELYHEKALKLYDSLNDKVGIDLSVSGLLGTYVIANQYKKFDSLYPKAQNLSKELNSETYFVNLHKKIQKEYFENNSVNMLKQSNNAINILKSTDFETLNFSNIYHPEDFKENLLLLYQYYKAIAQVKISPNNPTNYNILFEIEEQKFETSLRHDVNNHRKLATLNYYKYLYYTNAKKDLDSATYYLLKSDSYKYIALAEIEDKNSRNGELISKIINAEQKLNLANEISKKDAKHSKIFLISTIATSVILLITLLVFYFYFKARKNIEKVNQALEASNKKLIAIDKTRLEFFSILSHELRTPIYGISGLATLINQERDPVKKQGYLDSLISSSGYISTLIDNVLQANKLRLEQNKLHLKPEKIKNLLERVISTVEIAARDKGLQLHLNIDDNNEDEYILIDKVAFSQVLINLIYNAIRYTLEGSITVNVILKERTSKHVSLKFEIIDTGIGIEEKHRSVVFSAFENKTFLHKNSSGSGLGLYIVKTLLKSFNSDIDFISEPLKGTTFFFEAKFKIAKNKPRHKLNSPILDKDIRVLVVDDNKINLLITKKNIEKIERHYCDTASDGKESICMVKEKDYDLILMDINMPDMDGYEVSKHIRMFNSQIPIIALTALNSREIILKTQEAGINQIITKPYNFEEFKSIVLSYTQNQLQLSELIDLDTK